MERKTIGGFLAALRKANGMTQKELAEKLNVSDKTVSRWERDDGAPDLSLIPVIAEIFGVTCDELLRGERRRTEDAEAPTPKAEKQRQRLLTHSLSRCRIRTVLSMGIALVGFIAAMIGNLGFLRAYIGFFASTVFYLGSAVCQTIFLNNALLSVTDDSLPAEEAGQFRYSVIRLSQWSFGLTAVLFGASLPLVLLVRDAYAGLSAGSWLPRSLFCGGLAAVLCAVICYFLNAALLNQGVIAMKHEEVYRRNHRLKRIVALSAAAVLAVTGFAQALAANIWSVTALSEGTEFQDYDSFVAFMETERASEVSSGSAPEEVVAYYDSEGNWIAEEDALRETLYVYGGETEGQPVCSYIRRNGSVSRILYQEHDGSLLPITVYTHHDIRMGQLRFQVIQTGFAVLYGLEAAAALAVYFAKRAKA